MKSILMTIGYLFLINYVFSQKYCFSWATQIGDIGDNYSYDIVTDKQLNTYITGKFTGYQDFGGIALESNGTADIFIAKYDKYGQLLWANQAGGSTNWHESGRTICIDDQNNCYLSGTFRGLAKFNNKTIQSYDDSFDAFICKYSESGDLLWVNNIGGNEDDEENQIALDSDGNLVFAGKFWSERVWLENNTYIDGILEDALIMAKYNNQGKLVWNKKLYESTAAINFCFDLDQYDNIYAAGSFWHKSYFDHDTIMAETGIDKFICKFNKEGKRLWLKQVSGGNSIICTRVLLDHIGNIYTSGHFYDTVFFGNKQLVSHGESDIYLAKHDTSGNVEWATSAGDDNQDESYDLAYSLLDEIFLIGRFEDSIQFNNQLLQSNGLRDIIVSRFDTSGEHIFSQAFGGDSESQFADRGTGIDIGIQNGLSITGSFQGTFNFVDDSLTSHGQHNIYIVKWDTCQEDASSHGVKEMISLAPNPTQGMVHVTVLEDFETTRLRIINLIGQKIFDRVFYDRQFSFNPELPKGCYLFLFSNESDQQTHVKVIIH